MDYYSQLQEYLYNFLITVLISLLVYLWGFLEFSFVWVVVGTVVMMMWDQRKARRMQERREARELQEEGEETYLRSRMELPSWVTFPRLERAEWLNSLAGELWPHLEPLAWEVLQVRLEPAIASLLAEYHMAAFKFTRLELGELAPRVEGVTVTAVEQDKVLLDIDIVYEGDLRLSISLVKISAGVSDLRLRGKLRAVLHLVDVVPLVGGVEIMFLQSPNIDFDLHGAANFLDMPGLHGMIRQVVLESIKREIVYPNKVTLVTADNVPIYKMFLPKPTGILKLTIVEAANLPQSDFGGLFSIDPYCVVQVGSITKTTKRNTGSNPVWNEDFEFPIDFVEEQTLTVSIYDSDKLSDDEYLGTVQLHLQDIKEAEFQDVWFDLESAGKIKIRTCWYDVTQENDHGAARIIAGFIGTIKADGKSESTESSGLQILVETEDDTFSSKVVQSENGRTVFNEGFMLMNKISEKKICLKIIDSENGNKLGQRYLNLWEIKKLPKCLEINTEKQRFSVEAAFSLYSLKQSDNKACKETIDNIDKLKKESTSFLTTPIERSSLRTTLPSMSKSLMPLRQRSNQSVRNDSNKSFETLLSSLHSSKQSIPSKPPRGEVETNGTNGNHEVSLSEAMAGLRHIDSETSSVDTDSWDRRKHHSSHGKMSKI